MKIFKILIINIVILVSCESKRKDTIQAPKDIVTEEIAEVSDAEELLIKRCYPCHGPNTASHDDIIAPPMAAIKFRYKKRYQDEQEFVDAIVNWSMDPKIEKSLMRHAVDRFELMPKQEFDERELKTIAQFTYRSDLEEPLWFESHRNEMHSKKRSDLK